ncbi:MAG: OsmC family protein, partial [Comamonas sp.]
MVHSAHAQSTDTSYRVTLTDPQGHTWYVDEPREQGGADSAPNPIQLLLSALAACTTVTLQMYADRKQWP